MSIPLDLCTRIIPVHCRILIILILFIPFILQFQNQSRITISAPSPQSTLLPRFCQSSGGYMNPSALFRYHHLGHRHPRHHHLGIISSVPLSRVDSVHVMSTRRRVDRIASDTPSNGHHRIAIGPHHHRSVEWNGRQPFPVFLDPSLTILHISLLFFYLISILSAFFELIVSV